MEETGGSQASFTDPDARLMKTRHGFGACYSIQTAVDSETHLITDYDVTSSCTDSGLPAQTMQPRREREPGGILSVTADKGYVDGKDTIRCLENGILPM